MPLMQAGTTFNAAGDSHPGLQRSGNEDRFHCDAAHGIFIVVDGVGGQAAGEKAAETALATVRARLERETGPVEDRVREAIALANNEVHRLASLRAEWQGMACVLTIAVVSNGDVIIGHVGDTRLYKLRAGGIEKLTRDHSPVGEREDAGELSELEAMQHPRRNEVYRDVGSDHHDLDDPEFIDVFRAPLESDAALLLCSDGLTDQVTSATITEIVSDFAGHPFEIVHALIDAANAAGGKDNVTVVYAEGPRFAEGEDTRDLRQRRVSIAAASDRRVATSAPAGDVPSAQTKKPRRRWRTAVLVVLLFAVAGIGAYGQRHRLPLDRLIRLWSLAGAPSGSSPDSSPVRVTPGRSIAAAVIGAAPGTEILVEPGEYREQIRLKTGVRISSRVPRAATLRLPGGASETDAAVVAFDVSDAHISGFRIEGDAATPLGVGIVIRNSTVTVSDVDISGARNAAVEYVGNGGGSLLGNDLHDNPGAALVVRAGSSPRITHNTFTRNAGSERAPGTLLVEAAARPVITGNTFHSVGPDSLVVPGAGRAAILRDNWFVSAPAERPIAPPARAGRGRR
ncbi:MAG TPA: protein phosphatase 2C domain-containing protein [Vicinamibacterales bacterium]|nr:protein phosphatase 2C domain-containing protein [Vicinamibacterales bacterium]